MDEFDSIHSEDGSPTDGPQAPLPIGSTDLETALLSRLDDDKAQDRDDDDDGAGDDEYDDYEDDDDDDDDVGPTPSRWQGEPAGAKEGA